MNFIQRTSSFLVDRIFPQECVYCSAVPDVTGTFLCNSCRCDMARIDFPYCHHCGVPLEVSYADSTDQFTCAFCRTSAFAFDRARSLGVYDSILRELIHYFKYDNHPGVVRELRILLRKHFEHSGELHRDFCIVPVPLHVRKLKERGFDQSYLLGQELAGILRVPLLDGVIRRIRDTEPQARVSRSERQRNVKGAFRVERSTDIRDRDLLVVDDVFTTGATVDEVTRTLKRAGAGRVHVFTLARVCLESA